MSDDVLGQRQEAFRDAARAANIPPEVVTAFLSLMDAYLDRATMIAANVQVHRPPRYTVAEEDFDSPVGDDAGRVFD